MNNLWAPWRIEYITSPKDLSCVFCSAPGTNDKLILASGRLCFAIMNRFPYTTGHCMVAPYRHVGDLTEVSTEEISEIMTMTKSIITAIKPALKPQGFNVGFNLGDVAGAGIANHLHMHIVPRWKGDTNFMPVLGEVHIISEHIENTLDKIKGNLA
jgi:ATP adenylyltransferase